MKKTLLLCGAFLIGSFVQMKAQTATAPTIGDGSTLNPYQIATLDNLYWMASQVAGGTVNFDNQNFIQTADIDAAATSTWTNAAGKMGTTGTGFLPIGYKNGGTTLTAFKGNYNGQNFKIKNLFINSIYNCTGLFGNISSQDTIQNVRLENISITSTAQNVGGLIGQQSAGGTTTILNCSVNGAMSSTVASAQMGGLIGISNAPINISNCYANCTISEGATDNATHVGGLMGWLKGGTISNCYATGTIKAKSTVGGLIGNISAASTITNCYSTSAITATTTPKGGFIGSATATTVTNCFWNTETSGQATSAGTEIGKTTAEMTTQSTFTGWDFTGIWGITSGYNGGYPHLIYFSSPITSVSTPKVNNMSVFTINGTLHVDNIDSYTVYSTSGAKLATVNKNTSEKGVKLQAGVYIIKSQDNVQKVVMR